MHDEWTVGETAQLTLSVDSLQGVPSDPAALRLKIDPPLGIRIELIYGTDATIVRDSAGRFHADLELTMKGIWSYRWETNSPGTTAIEGSLTVKQGRFH